MCVAQQANPFNFSKFGETYYLANDNYYFHPNTVSIHKDKIYRVVFAHYGEILLKVYNLKSAPTVLYPEKTITLDPYIRHILVDYENKPIRIRGDLGYRLDIGNYHAVIHMEGSIIAVGTKHIIVPDGDDYRVVFPNEYGTLKKIYHGSVIIYKDNRNRLYLYKSKGRTKYIWFLLSDTEGYLLDSKGDILVNEVRGEGSTFILIFGLSATRCGSGKCTENLSIFKLVNDEVDLHSQYVGNGLWKFKYGFYRGDEIFISGDFKPLYTASGTKTGAPFAIWKGG